MSTAFDDIIFSSYFNYFKYCRYNFFKIFVLFAVKKSSNTSIVALFFIR